MCSDLEAMGAMGIQCEGEVLGVEGNEDSCMDAEFSNTSSEGRKEGGREKEKVSGQRKDTQSEGGREGGSE